MMLEMVEVRVEELEELDAEDELRAVDEEEEEEEEEKEKEEEDKNATWRSEDVSQDFNDATIVHLYKRNGNRQLCDNYRGIWLVNIAGKIFVRIILNLLNGYLESKDFCRKVNMAFNDIGALLIWWLPVVSCRRRQLTSSVPSWIGESLQYDE
nr:unnamed protein product [Spirometra erinaceieuropaei]